MRVAGNRDRERTSSTSLTDLGRVHQRGPPMMMRNVCSRDTKGALTVACVLTASSAVVAAPLLRNADVRVTVTSPTSCEVRMALTVDGAGEIDHRVETVAGSRTELVETRGAERVGEVRAIGRTQSLVLRPGQPAYEFSYRVRQPEDLRDRCPIWLPAVPADGRSREVRVYVDLPQGAQPGGSMPAFIWSGNQGSARLGHLPAFVRAPFAPEGVTPGWSIGSIMDAAAVLVFVAASAVWVWRRR